MNATRPTRSRLTDPPSLPLSLIRLPADLGLSMKKIHIVGIASPGKTRLMELLIPLLTARGLRVGSIKHSPHRHELDKPGKDSHRHRCAGAAPAAAITEGLMAVYLPLTGDQDPYLLLEPLYAGCDVVLVEGGAELGGMKIEVWSPNSETRPWSSGDPAYIAAVGDGLPSLPCPAFPWGSDFQHLADLIIERIQA